MRTALAALVCTSPCTVSLRAHTKPAAQNNVAAAIAATLNATAATPTTPCPQIGERTTRPSAACSFNAWRSIVLKRGAGDEVHEMNTHHRRDTLLHRRWIMRLSCYIRCPVSPAQRPACNNRQPRPSPPLAPGCKAAQHAPLMNTLSVPPFDCVFCSENIFRKAHVYLT